MRETATMNIFVHVVCNRHIQKETYITDDTEKFSYRNVVWKTTSDYGKYPE